MVNAMTRHKTQKIARTYRLPPSTVARLDNYAERQGITLTAAIAILLNYALDHLNPDNGRESEKEH